MSKRALQHYQARMQRVLDHIDQHLDGALDVATLSGVAAFSKHHFQRQFSATFGIGVGRYVQLARLKRASYRLAFRQSEPVIEIALDSGYEGPEAFARMFRERIDQSPTQFRREPQWNSWHAAFAPLHQARSKHMTKTFDKESVTIIDFPATPVAMMEHWGDPKAVGATIRRFIDWRKGAGLPPGTSETFNIFHCDPDETPADEFRLDICAATGRAIEPNDQGVTEGLIPGGRCAVLRLTGSSDDLRSASHFLYGEWLAASGEEPRDFPFFVQRVAFMPDVPEHEAVTDLFLPLQ
ncbi:MAG: AraC family transcriptional regulator [Sphingomicrobium sp.]